MSALPLIIRYSNLIATLLEFDNDIAAGSSNAQLAQTVTSFTALAQAQEDASQQRALVFSALQAGAFETGALSATTAAQSNQQSVTATYQKVSANLPSYVPGTGLTANLTQAQQFSNIVTGPQIDLATQAENDAIQASTLGEPLGGVVSGSASQLFANMTFTLGQMRQVEQDELTSIAVQASATQAGAQNSAELTSIIVAVVILLVLIATVVMARSMIIPLRRLRADALDVAGRRLPTMVQRLSQEARREHRDRADRHRLHRRDRRGGPRVRPGARRGRAAGRRRGHAAGQPERHVRQPVPPQPDADRAAARHHRVARADRAGLQPAEQPVPARPPGDPDAPQLGEPARARRARGAAQVDAAGALVDVLRAAVSEIEQYERITLNVQSGLVIAGKAASDVVHLVAELVENATTFSRKDTQVFVTGQILVSGGVLIEITDEGLGIPEQELAYANWRLDNPPVIDVAVSRRMGLFVVGRLAARHGIKVRLRRAQSGGLSALIWVPETVAETEPATPRRLTPPLRHHRRPAGRDHQPRAGGERDQDAGAGGQDAGPPEVHLVRHRRRGPRPEP